MNEPDAGLVVTVICTAPGHESWYFRGSADDGIDAANTHEEGHADDQQVMADPAGQVSIIEDIPGEDLRERRGRIVREIWVQAAHERGDTKESHLKTWPDLDPYNRALDERIGAALAADERARQAEADRASKPRVSDAAARAAGFLEQGHDPFSPGRTTHAGLRAFRDPSWRGGLEAGQ